MEQTEILEASNLYGENNSLYEVEKEYLRWEERQKQVRSGVNELVYCLFENVRSYNHGKGLVTSWLSIGKSEWENCRRVIRKIQS